MVPVISHSRWTDWCARERLPLEDADFALETCYYGTGWRSRPGTLLLTSSALIHSSYSWQQTLWAIGEPCIRVEIRLPDIAAAQRRPLSWFLRVKQLWPESHFRVLDRNGGVHDLILQRGGRDFAAALAKHGIEFTEARSLE